MPPPCGCMWMPPPLTRNTLSDKFLRYTQFRLGGRWKLGQPRRGGRHMSCHALGCARAISRLALFIMLVNVFGWGQTITSTIVGQVNDPTGAGLPAARVIAKNAETGIATEGATDSSGAYSIQALQPGIY